MILDANLTLAKLAIDCAFELDVDYEHGIEGIDVEDGQSKREEAQKHLDTADEIMKRLNISDTGLEERVEQLESELHP